jgi:hypothetical protein
MPSALTTRFAVCDESIRPAHYPTGERVEHHRAIDLAFTSWMLDVGVGPERPVRLSSCGFLRPALRTGRAILTASGSRRAALVVHPVAGWVMVQGVPYPGSAVAVAGDRDAGCAAERNPVMGDSSLGRSTSAGLRARRFVRVCGVSRSLSDARRGSRSARTPNRRGPVAQGEHLRFRQLRVAEPPAMSLSHSRTSTRGRIQREGSLFVAQHPEGATPSTSGITTARSTADLSFPMGHSLARPSRRSDSNC